MLYEVITIPEQNYRGMHWYRNRYGQMYDDDRPIIYRRYTVSEQ